MGYPIMLLNNPPPPTYPEYEDLLAQAHAECPQFVNPANLYPHRPIVERRGHDWCTAVLGRPYELAARLSRVDCYLLIVADRAGIDPPLPDWIVQGREAGERARQQRAERVQARQRIIQQRWDDARADTDTADQLEVWDGSRGRAWTGGDPIRHVVPTIDVYSGTGRRTRIHPAGRGLCETVQRPKPLRLAGRTDQPATCDACLRRTPQIRGSQ